MYVFCRDESIEDAVFVIVRPQAVDRKLRQLTKTKGGFANETSLLKLLYAWMLKASDKWTHPAQNWNVTLSQLSLNFPNRVDQYVDCDLC
ncbi:hypothetical protein CAG71_14760 [Photobacterium halotolerans]|nr:hypothetical protein [Photobacterium halotolerans]